ncbi:MAG: hypothetical protein EA342_00965 [Leptolyngbya sp. LCM1.Bin17]|nr:MAG: hypothetical protein EA342_00965 [Leptolyngbya sp. LCM1.Bin17]
MGEAQLKQRIIQKLEGMEQDSLAFLDRFIDSLAIYQRTQRLTESDAPVAHVEPDSFIRSLRGKYAHVATSSDEFARRKQKEIDWEDRHWKK